MAKPKPDPYKKSILKKHNTFHARAQEVTDKLFQEYDFFDPQDLLQVKYEMLRRVRIDGLSIIQAVQAFGFSRPAFYKAMKAFDQYGLWGLLPAKKGPRRSHKLSQTVMDFIACKREQDPSLKVQDLVILLQEEFGFRVHPRSIERALQRAEKKTP
jgi:transposase